MVTVSFYSPFQSTPSANPLKHNPTNSMAAGRFGSTKLPMLLGAAAMALTLLAMLVVSPSLKSGTPTELIGGMDFAGG